MTYHMFYYYVRCQLFASYLSSFNVYVSSSDWCWFELSISYFRTVPGERCWLAPGWRTLQQWVLASCGELFQTQPSAGQPSCRADWWAVTEPGSACTLCSSTVASSLPPRLMSVIRENWSQAQPTRSANTRWYPGWENFCFWKSKSLPRLLIC